MRKRADNLLVIGASGFLGGCIVRSRDTRFEFIAPDRSALDVTRPASVSSAFDALRPEFVILSAALADIDRCEKDPGLAHAINVEGAKTVACECARRGVRLLFTSSGAVFDGTADSYRESDPPNPLSVYGKSKAEAERVIREIVPDAIVVRLALVLGFSPHGGTNALLDKLKANFSKGNTVSAPADEFRNAIDSNTAARWILDLASAPGASGIFHLGAEDAASRYEIVRKLAAAMGYAPGLVMPSNSSPDRAPRGRRQMLVPTRIQQYSSIPVPTSMQTIERCMNASF
jgi:dTDP-4-dehydrorhamnose reductase